VRKGQLGQLQVTKGGPPRLEATVPDRRNQHLRQGQRVGPELVVECVGQQGLGGRLVVVVSVQVGNENAGVKDDHAGQPLRSRRR